VNKGLFYISRPQFNSSGAGCADFCAEAGKTMEGLSVQRRRPRRLAEIRSEARALAAQGIKAA
jgi:hypothetical protein